MTSAIEKMARAILCLSVTVLSAATIYAAGAFVLWDINPGHWDVFGRLTVVFFGGFVGILGGSIAFANWWR